MTAGATAPALLWLSPYATIHWEGEEICARSLLEQRGVAGGDAALLLVMHAFAQPRTLADAGDALEGLLAAPDVAAIAAELQAAGVLVSQQPDCFWQAADLAFQIASTPAGEVKLTPSARVDDLRPPLGGARTSLARAPAPAPGSLAASLLERRSLRRFAAGSFGADRFAELLERSMGRCGVQPDGSWQRAYPSGGAIHSLELYAVVPAGAIDGVAGGIHHYAPAEHVLELVSSDAGDVAPYLSSARAMMGAAPDEGGPPVVLLVTSRFRRVCEGYASIAYRLVLVELGCLVQTLQLVATSLGLGACALGGVTGGDRLAKLLGVHPLEEPLIGAIALGVPARADGCRPGGPLSSSGGH